MPKCYSQQEREYINCRLKEEAAKCLAQYGIRHTTVDEIVKRVKIPKGTFYLFYQSKELLLFEIITEYHEVIEQQLITSILDIDPEHITAEELTDVLCRLYKMASDNPLLHMIHSDEVELLARKLPPEVLSEHMNQDTQMIERVFEALNAPKDININAFSAAFRSIYFVTLHKEEIGADSYEEALRLMILGLVKQLM